MSVVTGSSIVTFTGKVIDPLNPDPEQICIEDIAHHLGMMCRFTGATSRFYSVAQHSYYVSTMVPRQHQLKGLLHDAPEAYLWDLASPVKNAGDELGDRYRWLENQLENAIWWKFNLGVVGTRRIPESVKKADQAMLYLEGKEFMPDNFDPGVEEPEFQDLDQFFIIPSWAPDVAEIKFLERYEEIK